MKEPRPEYAELDLSGVETPDALQETLARAFGFPDYYGHNWNAFWDCISTTSMPKRLRIRGWENVRRKCPLDGTVMLECLADLNREYPESAVIVEWA